MANLWCSAEGRCRPIRFYVLLTQAEVGQDDVPLRIQQNVLGLQVSVHDVQRVQVPQSARDLRGVEPRARLQKTSLPLQVIKQLSKETKKTD